MILLHPHRVFQTPLDVTAETLRQMGVCALLLDIDGTLAEKHAPEPPPGIVAWAEQLRRDGIRLFVLSNNRRPQRVRHFGEKLGCGFIHRARKPWKKGFARALAALGCAPEQAALLGDQIFTDVLGARRSGLYALRVESVDTHLWYFGLRRFFEKPFLQPKE